MVLWKAEGGRGRRERKREIEKPSLKRDGTGLGRMHLIRRLGSTEVGD